jgi:hypothetical protein
LDGTKNPHRGEVLLDIRDSIIREPAGKKGPAKYWSKEEQDKKLTTAFDKWSSRGKVWSAAASKVSEDLSQITAELSEDPPDCV